MHEELTCVNVSMKDTGNDAGAKNKPCSTVTMLKPSVSAFKELAASHPYAKRRHKKISLHTNRRHPPRKIYSER